MAEEEEKGGGMVKDMGGAAVAPLPGIETYRRLAGAAYGLERGGIEEEEEGAKEGGGGRGAEVVVVATEDGGGRGGACEAPLLAVGGGIVNAGVEADAGDDSLFSGLLLVLLTAVGVEDWSTDSLLAEEAIDSEASSEESAEAEEEGGAGVEDCWALLAGSSVLTSVFTVAEDTKGDGGGTQDVKLGGRAG